MEEKKLESGKRFGSRYGRHLREKVSEIESGHRGKHKCPYCGKNKVKRLAVGIWFCNACKAKFAGGAYSITRKAPVEESEEEPSKIKAKKETDEVSESN